MIKMILLDGQYCPVVVCDWCQERISQVASAGYWWRVGLPTGEPVDGQPVFLHKLCSDDFEEANREEDRAWYWGELRDFVEYLPSNLGGKA
jgi:hypothetical protein